MSSCCERRQTGVVPQEGVQEFVGAHRWQRVEPELGVVGLAAPAVLILGAIVDQQQQPGRRQALDQAVEQGLRLGIDPVQILEDQQQGLHLTFAQQHALQAVERASAPLRRVEGAKRAVLRQGVQERQQGGDGLLQGGVERQHLPRHSGPDGAGVVAVLHLDIALQQVEHREVRRGFAVGHRGALEHQPALGAVRVDHFVHQARLAHAGLAEERHHLPVPGARPLQRLVQRRQLRLPAHKAGEPAGDCGLQAPADGAGPDQLEDLHGLVHPLDRHGSQGVDLDQALHQPQGGGGQQNAAGCGELLHARRQDRGQADGGVVHVQVVANGPHHDLSGVEPDAHLHRQAVGAAHLFGIAAQGVLHGQRGITGACGVVFVGQRRPEQRHDAITEHLVHRTLIAVHGLHHGVQGRVQDGPGLFRVEVADQLRRALEVGKQHRDLLALAFQGAFGGQDLLGEIGGRVGERCMVLGAGWGSCRVGSGALGTRPDQDIALLIDRQALALNEFVL